MQECSLEDIGSLYLVQVSSLVVWLFSCCVFSGPPNLVDFKGNIAFQ